MITFLSFIFTLVGLTTAILVVTSKVPMNAALFLVVTLFTVAANYVLLGAEFLAAVQVIVYAGAIMVLIIFVIQLVGFQPSKDGSVQKQTPIAIVAAGLLFVQIAFYTVRSLTQLNGIQKPVQAAVDHTASFSQTLFTKYLLPFETASILLLVAIVGTVLLAQHKGIRE
ncbi:MAG: NADH-quinone oxidoreductase subunit J [Candidatus Omnitrophica bacterium]|nr:NADH-quinone oxidoreductase subunit J [Candidatus Omnitrophota bacterium]